MNAARPLKPSGLARDCLPPESPERAKAALSAWIDELLGDFVKKPVV
jgi:hypothetical protein